MTNRAVTVFFMGLPRELRDMVYHELWRETAVINILRNYDDDDPNFEIRYVAPSTDYKAKQGLNQLYTRATWDVDWKLLSTVDESRWSRLISLREATNLRLLSWPVDNHSEPASSITTLATASRTDLLLSLDISGPILCLDSLLEHSLHSLTIDTWHEFVREDNIVDKSWTFRIAGLDNCKMRLRSFKLVWMMIGCAYDIRACVPAFELACKAETVRIGKLLVGQTRPQEPATFGSESWGGSEKCIEGWRVNLAYRYYRKD
ncbi:hypothetical protein SVAN01_10768 [Stagonosporopsis vannaccii]|nr:hypothetical protein SVAN01_10768 [Stagonosporopsis vannaccii]